MLAFSLPTTIGAHSMEFAPVNGARVQVAKKLPPAGNFTGGLWVLEASLEEGESPAFSSVHVFGSLAGGEPRKNLIDLPPCKKARFVCLASPMIDGQIANTAAALIELL